MRSIRVRWRSLFVLVLVVVAAGCGTDVPLPSRTPAAGGLDDSPAPSATSSRLSEFEAHLRDATTREGTLGPASGGSAADVRHAVGQLRDWADGERAWLTDHPADPCFDAAASKLEAAIDSIDGAADWLEASATATIAPSDDVSLPSARTEAVNALQDADRALADAAALAQAARPNCS